MFPTISHLIDYLFGINIPLPFNTFGVLVAFAFVAAYWAMSKELKRKEALGVLHPVKKTVTVGAPASAMELASNAFFGFLVGYKLVYAAMHYGELIADAQGVILSLKGSLIGGLISGALFVYLAYADKKKQQLDKPKQVEVLQHPHEIMSNVVVWAAVFGFMGAKLFDNLEHWDQFVKDPIGGLLSFDGLTFYGGLICGGAAVLYIAYKNGIKPLHMLDVGGPGMMLAYSVGRIGCQLAGDGDWGVDNLDPKPFSWLPDWLWAYTYPHNVAQAGDRMADCVGKYCFELRNPAYPTPIYEVIMAFILFLILWKLKDKIKYPGMLFGIYLILNGIERFCIELIRVNTKYHIGSLSFTQAEMIAVFLVLSGIGLIIYSRKQTPMPTSA